MKECPCINCICTPICKNKVDIKEESTIIVLDLMFNKIFKDCNLAKEFYMSENTKYTHAYRIHVILDALGYPRSVRR